MPTRRQVLKSVLAAWAAPAILSATSLGQGRTAPSDRLSIGVIGLGSRGLNLIDDLLRASDAQITMLCDVDTIHYRDQPWGKGKAFGLEPTSEYVQKKDPTTRGLRTTKDFREVTAASDIDAVVVATPDHWHALITLDAIANGKDVYCEKPVTHTFAEGQSVYRAAHKHDVIFQTGSQQRSSPEFRQAVEIVRNGHLGNLREIEVGLSPGYEKPQGDPTVRQPPESLDYEMWCGPAPKLPYMRARHHRWWRGHRAFGGGVLMDWIGHHNDIAHWAMDGDNSGPTRVEAVGWTFPETDVYDTPVQYEIRCEYASGVKTSISSQHKNGALFRGDDGWVYVTRGKLLASNQAWAAKDFDAGPKKVYLSDNHMRNFLDGIKSRKACISPAETTHRSITPGHLGYVSHTLGRPLKWDPMAETMVGDEAAMQLLLKNEYRSPWG
ncbi:Glucose--fructose oxidoreductase precursor [Bremerella volcania]|uniref:Glucose--fructose oxidoreductase n=1 Tax=Bremerella volcania TaxID=2527984 RepID=A0A518C849_9BACT|nr:Gfo/Idh/MocA family oxidoreductase [Bremerella volcania]QDU75401.1 Glucose--fructose oxidoreductase precursor [Bremerella volcania]